MVSLLVAMAVVASFIVSLPTSIAVCPQPDIATFRACTSGCPDTVKYPQKHADCSNICLASWGRVQDAYYACQKQEREEAAAKKAELEKSVSVSKFKGKVTIKRADGTQVAAGVDMILKDGDTVFTDEKTTATLRMPDGTMITLGPDSRFKYDEMNYGFSIAKGVGRLRALVTHRRERWEIRTPPAVLAVRGTEFIIDYDPVRESTTVYLYDGLVDMTNVNNVTKELIAGNVMSVDMSGRFVTAPLNRTVWDEFKQSIVNGEEYDPPEPVVSTYAVTEQATPSAEPPETSGVDEAAEMKSQAREGLSRSAIVSVVSLLVVLLGIIILTKRLMKKKKRRGL